MDPEHLRIYFVYIFNLKEQLKFCEGLLHVVGTTGQIYLFFFHKLESHLSPF